MLETKTILCAALLICSIAVAVDVEGTPLLIDTDRCTTIAVGAKAGINGPMSTHTADGSDSDFRISKTPAMDWEDGTMRPLYLYRGNYPSIVTSLRGETWKPENLDGTDEQLKSWGKESPTTGYIPQVSHTYALLESNYGIMNEHQVAIGESTCAARFWMAPTTNSGVARIEVGEMSRLALERCTTARETIQMMGDLATQYGFYAADWSGGDNSLGEGGEALTVIDKTEAWVFHVLGDDTGTSAIWVAQRVPDDHVTVVANQFVIRKVDPNSDDFMYSDNLWEVAIRNGLWTKDAGKLDFLRTYGLPRAHSPYATRRVWRVFNIVAPSLILPPFTDMWGSDYPFSVKAEKVLTPEDLIQINRDHYEGTQFDMTQGLAAGPFGDPNRFDWAPVDNMTAYQVIQGSYERAISLYRTSYSWVAQARPDVPDQFAMLWFSQYAPATSSYVPLYVAADRVPIQFSSGSLYKYDDNVAFWVFTAVGNYAGRFYRYAIEDIRALQAQLFNTATASVQQAEVTAAVMLQADPVLNKGPVSKLLNEVTVQEANRVVGAWRDFFPQLITKYHDGYRAANLDGADISMQKLFYPKYWLDATGFWLNKANTGPGVLLFEPSPESTTSSFSISPVVASNIVTAIVSSVITALLCAFYMRHKQRQLKYEYAEIEV